MQPSDFNMVAHKLEVIRTYDGEDTLQVLVKPDATQAAIFPDLAFYAGRCVHFNASRQGELGVSGHQVPLWLFRQSNLPSGGFNGTAATAATQLSWQDGTLGEYLAFVGMPGLEIATSEFNSALTYGINDLLTAPLFGDAAFDTDAKKLAGAGVVTNASVSWGKTPVVGVVSNTDKTSNHAGLSMLRFYTMYMPPIEALPDGFDEPTWSV